MSDFPLGSVTVTSTTAYQADCERCGWHTRQADSRWWVNQMARQHLAVCPNPYRRCGAVMECGCWYHAMPGDVARRTKATCPLHGETLMVNSNVDEPVAHGSGSWTPQR